jgi:hypothetical protein
VKTLRPGLLALVCLLSLVVTGAASAQKATTISFETDCNGAPVPGGGFGGLYNTKRVTGTLYASCGVSSITSEGAGSEQVHAQSNGVRPIPGVDGNVALAGAADFGLLLSNNASEVSITFSPPVNEVSFDVLDLDNSNGLSITLFGAQGAVLSPVEMPTPSGKRVSFSRTSVAPIARVTIAYQANLVLIGGDAWYVDKLKFNAYVCGDGELETGEACDDGNRVQCDVCNNSCQAGVPGCFNGTTCVATGAVSGCTQCDAATPAGPSGEKPTTPRPAGTACDDGLFCTLAGSCDAAGTCVSPPNTCDDSVVCTFDSCDESTDTCLHPVADQSCLIGGSCYLNGQANPTNICEVCAAATSSTAWAKQPAGQQCGDPSCTMGVSLPAATCSAAGVCTPGASTSCMFMQCANAVSCDGLCTGDQNCAQQAHCLATTMMCVPDLTAGTECTRNNECASNFCTDGVCCDTSCSGACESCDQADKLGVCTPLPAMMVDPQMLCSANQFCSADGKCTSPPPVMRPPVDKPPVTVDVRPMGTGCDRNEVCGSGICKDGVCCDRACEGLCESCNVPGQIIGQCTPYELGQDPESECGGAGSVCNGADACTSYETRGNGLCSAAPSRQGQPGHGDAAALASLVTLATMLLLRRKLARGSSRKLT